MANNFGMRVNNWHIHRNRQNSTGNPFADLIAMAITAAIERAAPNYLPLTRTANAEVFYGLGTALPPGPYSPAYQEYYRQLELQKSKLT